MAVVWLVPADPAAAALTIVFDAFPGLIVRIMGSMTVPLSLDYGEIMRSGWEILGAFMYPSDAVARLLSLIDAGLLDLDRIPRRTFPLADLPPAMEAAAARNAPLVVMTR